ncbi:MAG: Crp/Fnr family transcriptional regulator [Betaproteobacteria bacterium]
MAVMQQTGHGGAGNRLLDALPASTRSRLLEGAEVESCNHLEQLYGAGDAMEHCFFPTTCVCSLVADLASGQRAEIAIVGNEGFVGMPAVLGIPPRERALAQVPGEYYPVKASRLRALMDRDAALREAVLRQSGRIYDMVKQTALCNAYHSVEQRVARWILTLADRAGSDELPMTQEMLAGMVSATRPRTAEAAGRLRTAGIIATRRGATAIRDRARLERRACECYQATRLTT